jgi:hypothetical protein
MAIRLLGVFIAAISAISIATAAPGVHLATAQDMEPLRLVLIAVGIVLAVQP